MEDSRSVLPVIPTRGEEFLRISGEIFLLCGERRIVSI